MASCGRKGSPSERREFAPACSLEGERFVFPLPTVAALPASPSRAGALRPRGHTPLEPPQTETDLPNSLRYPHACLTVGICFCSALRPTISATQTSSYSPLDWPRGVGGINKYDKILGCIAVPFRPSRRSQELLIKRWDAVFPQLI